MRIMVIPGWNRMLRSIMLYKRGCASNFSIFLALNKEAPKKLSGKSTCAQMWISRQLNDPYIELARINNYRCRSAFKLIEIDDKHKILKPGQIVVDCGAAPGSWTQVAVKRTNADKADDSSPKGTVIAIDKSPIYPIEGAIILSRCDFLATETWNKLIELLDGRQIDVVVSDMAPNATGIKDMDHDNIMKLCYSVFRFAVMFSTPGATCLIKIFDGYSAITLESELKRFYKNVRWIKPKSSRDESAEKFILCQDFRGLKKNPQVSK